MCGSISARNGISFPTTKRAHRAVVRTGESCYDYAMDRTRQPTERQRLQEELRKLKHLQKTRMLSLDDGQFVREVVTEMYRRISEIEAELSDSDQLDSKE